ncbi:hypothetical protein MUN89_00300 [Halobacillus salinarum]|uniref:Uncharacterized protein n=1 Tax=Halobacillus salinarum TaxID=2932257 RepID=A0ABY4ELF3_9BACI|nr:hypothetical protein [Halobacillus salinarum]UOQ44474.1 hypothetical protein MUN89_00300 [Halobacillus salinarum]
MAQREEVCIACDGRGLLVDDEEWSYTCKICDGTGIMPQDGIPANRQPADVDEMNRILD